MKAQQEKQSYGTEMVSGLNGLDSLEQARGKFSSTGGMSAEATSAEGRAADSASGSQESGGWQEMMKTSWQSLSDSVTSNASWQKLTDTVKSASPTSLAIGAVAAGAAVGAAVWLGRKQWITPEPSASRSRSTAKSARQSSHRASSSKSASHRDSRNTLEQ